MENVFPAVLGLLAVDIFFCRRSLAHVWYGSKRSLIAIYGPEYLQDFSIGFVLVAVVCALTFGQVGDTIHGENFFDQMRNSHVQAHVPSFLHACLYMKVL